MGTPCGQNQTVTTGLFFGSFNPIHNGHLGIARYLSDKRYCEEVWFVVSPCNPFKKDQSLLPELRRFEMVQKAVADDPHLKACDVEFDMPRPSYTADTLQLLYHRFPTRRFMLVIGGDNLCDFHLWKGYEGILSRVPLLVYPRPGVPVTPADHPNVRVVDAPLFSFSSTEIRRKIAVGENISGWVPPVILPSVLEYYREKRSK